MKAPATKWTLYRWCWRLLAPIHIGLAPAGTRERCRLCLPARPLHGAITSEIARRRTPDAFPDYGKYGFEVALNTRLTCLYPADLAGPEARVFLPRFGAETGLMWHPTSPDGRPLGPARGDQEMRRQWLSVRPGGGREIECLGPAWAESYGDDEPEPIFLVGYVFLRNDAYHRQIREISSVFVGGEQRHGLGRIALESFEAVRQQPSLFGYPVYLNEEDPLIETPLPFGHTLAADAEGFCGAVEQLAGWEVRQPLAGPLAYVPGSLGPDRLWRIDTYGIWCAPALGSAEVSAAPRLRGREDLAEKRYF